MAKASYTLNKRTCYLRYHDVLLIRIPEMFRQQFRSKLEREWGQKWGDGGLWYRWCLKNNEIITSYPNFRSLRNLCQEVDDRFVPIFESCDPSFFGHVTEDPEVKLAAKNFAYKRNLTMVDDQRREMAHTECKEECDWLKENVIWKLFNDFPKLKIRWTNDIKKLRLDQGEDGLEEVERKVEEALRRAEEAKRVLTMSLDSLSLGGDGRVERDEEQGATGPSSGFRSVLRSRKVRGPLSLSLISSPPVLGDGRLSSATWPVGDGFVAGFVNGKIVVWSGGQKQEDGCLPFLPSKVVFILELDPFAWRRIDSWGDVPPPTTFAASIVFEEFIYLFGGDVGDLIYKATNEIFRLSLSGEFVKLNPAGDLPSPRQEHRGWIHDGKFYFFGGYGPQVESSLKTNGIESKGEEWIQWRTEPELYFNNQLIEFDKIAKRFSLPLTNGKPPSARCNFAVAKVNEKTFIHGGFCEELRLKDFHSLNMITRCWEEIKNSGLSFGVSHHTLTPISDSQLLLVGGNKQGAVLKEVKVYDVDENTWEKKEDLPLDFCANGGLMFHQSVSAINNKVKSVICLGGYIDRQIKTHPGHLLKFDYYI